MILVVHEFPFVPIFQPTMNLGGESSSLGPELAPGHFVVKRSSLDMSMSRQ